MNNLINNDEILDLLYDTEFRKSLRLKDEGALTQLGYDLAMAPNIKVVTATANTMYLAISQPFDEALLSEQDIANIQAAGGSAGTTGSVGSATSASSIGSVCSTFSSAGTASTAGTAGTSGSAG